MEEVEEANRAAVEGCHRVLSMLSQPQDQVQYRNLMAETEEAVFKFKRVISLLNSGLGHARVRKLKELPTPLSQSILLDNPHHRTDLSSKNFQFLQPSNYLDNHPIQELGTNARSSLYSAIPSLELSSNEKKPLHLPQQTQLAHYHFIQEQQLQQRLQFQQQQQMKQQAELMFRRSNSGVNFNFDNSSCTATMSSTRSFISSLSIDGSVANLEGSAFHLIGTPGSSDQSSQQHKRKCSARGGEDGSVKCGNRGRCHCSKKRKHRIKRSIKVPAISNKLADIPPDDYSWRKYGQKPIKGSPHPRKENPLLKTSQGGENHTREASMKGYQHSRRGKIQATKGLKNPNPKGRQKKIYTTQPKQQHQSNPEKTPINPVKQPQHPRRNGLKEAQPSNVRSNTGECLVRENREKNHRRHGEEERTAGKDQRNTAA